MKRKMTMENKDFVIGQLKDEIETLKEVIKEARCNGQIELVDELTRIKIKLQNKVRKMESNFNL